MRLHSLKLAGFKSFVDPSTLRFAGPRTAVVGPNGCGKSNVIDAIRWVMGESSARQLRGDAMSDIIFAGTAQRKPVGQASVELLFENTLGKLGGAYNHYSELSVRRQVTRDGRSDYFLNGTRCRRRDITDIFLGTGLGPRSYAVIGQGMINRLVEARPDELRVFIEEAAGVSRYQARRRDTLNHLEQTRLNVARLQDVADELDSQMKRLKKQSQAAEHYKALQAESRQLHIELHSLAVEQLTVQQQQVTEQLTELSTRFGALRTHRQDLEAQWQQTSQHLTQLLAAAEPEQQHLQQCEHAYARAENAVQQHQQQCQHLAEQLAERHAQKTKLDQQQHDDQLAYNAIQAELADIEQQLNDLPDIQTLHVATAQYEDAWSSQQQHLQQLEQQVQHFSQTLARQQQDIAHIERQRLRHEQQLAQVQTRLDALQADSANDQLTDALQARDDCHIERVRVQQQIDDWTREQHSVNTAHAHTQADWQVLHQQRIDIQAEKNALLSLLHTAPTAQASGSKFESEPVLRLTDQLVLSEAGQAHVALIERVLGAWLSAAIGTQTRASHHLTPACGDGATVRGAPLQHAGLHALSDWIIAPHYSIWRSIAVAADGVDVHALRAKLSSGQSLLTQHGQWVGPDWQIDLMQTPPDASAGVLARQWRLQALEVAWQASDAHYHALSQTRQAQQQQLALLAERITHSQRQHAELERRFHQHELQCTRLTHAQALKQQQRDQLSQQYQQIQDALHDQQAELDDLYLERSQTQLRHEPQVLLIQPAKQQLEQIRQQRDAAREHSRKQHAQQQQLSSAQQVARSKQQLMAHSLQRVQQQQHEQHQQLTLTQQLHSQAVLDLPRYQAQQQTQLHEVTHARQQWSERQQRLEAVQQTQQRLSDARQTGQQDEDQLRDHMEQQRLAWQDIKSALAQAMQQLETLASPVQQGVRPDSGQRTARLHEIERQLARLGELNLAAPAALLELSARYDELTHQMDDLNQTIAQLETAMHSIDQETRSLFMSTFDRINHEFGILFPKVFGGGQASLSLEDGWQSGVRLMAQPLGKKNSSIALLSGGEKTLTALALVFAIFRLNPAPFCLLDEVDAPLDDANVQRFCGLVTELSQQVQFIYISHNKLAMSMADHLLGVTMPEAGVSRMVSVNLEQAAAFGITQE